MCQLWLWLLALTSKQHWVAGQCHTHCLGQQCGHGDAVGLQALVQRVKLVSLDAHGHAELRHLYTITITSRNTPYG